MSPQIQSPLIVPGALILVTAGNGLIASHIVDQLLHYGYHVRTTVRSESRSSWMNSLFAARHPNSSFELVEVPDINAAGCYDAAVVGVSAVIHTAANTSMSSEDGDKIISDAVDANLIVLDAVKEANKRGGDIKRVVLTSSSWAVMYPRPNTEKQLMADTYDDYAASLLADPALPKEYRGLMTYVESKKRAEQESWKWYQAQRQSCGFVLNAVIPSTCMGPVLDPEHQAYPSTVGFVRSLYEGKNAQLFDWLEPQWYSDVRDAARLHVAGAVLEGVESERIFGYAEPYTWTGVAEVLEREMGSKVPIEVKDRGRDLTTTAMRDVSVGYLKRLGLEGWVKFEESVKENIRSFYPKA